MRVELVTHNPPGIVSGIGRYVRELYRHLQPRIDVQLAADVPPPLSKQLSILQHFPIGVEGHQSGSIVHFTQIMGCAQMLWHPLQPSVMTVHDLGVLVCPEDKALFDPIGRAVLQLQYMGIPRMQQYSVNSERTRHDLIRLFHIPEDRIHFVQIGIELENFRIIPEAQEKILQKYNLKPDGFTLIYVGTEIPRKNFKLVLQALAALKARGYPVRLIKIGGAGGERWRQDSMNEIARLSLKDDVLFFGVVPEEDLPLFYNFADLAVTATLLEGGISWMVLEALACGKTAVVSESAAIPEDTRDGVTIVEDRSLDAMIAAIAHCLDNNDLRKQMGATGWQRAQRYTWKATVDAMIRVYEKVI